MQYLTQGFYLTLSNVGDRICRGSKVYKKQIKHHKLITEEALLTNSLESNILTKRQKKNFLKFISIPSILDSKNCQMFFFSYKFLQQTSEPLFSILFPDISEISIKQ